MGPIMTTVRITDHYGSLSLLSTQRFYSTSMENGPSWSGDPYFPGAFATGKPGSRPWTRAKPRLAGTGASHASESLCEGLERPSVNSIFGLGLCSDWMPKNYRSSITAHTSVTLTAWGKSCPKESARRVREGTNPKDPARVSQDPRGAKANKNPRLGWDRSGQERSITSRNVRRPLMGQRGRRSASELGVVSVDGKPSRLTPPDHLGADERRRFVELVANCDAGHFRPTDAALLCRYVESDALGERAARELRDGGPVLHGKASPWIVIQEKAIRAQVSLSMRLRLSPQSRLDPKTVARSKASESSVYDIMAGLE